MYRLADASEHWPGSLKLINRVKQAFEHPQARSLAVKAFEIF